MFRDAQRVDQSVIQEHYRLVMGAMKREIELRKRHMDYVVPTVLYGVFPSFEVDEMVLWLIKRLREDGFTVQLISAESHIIRVSGWFQELELREDQERKAMSGMTVTLEEEPTEDPGEVIERRERQALTVNLDQLRDKYRT
jgi:hypothetical protein